MDTAFFYDGISYRYANQIDDTKVWETKLFKALYGNTTTFVLKNDSDNEMNYLYININNDHIYAFQGIPWFFKYKPLKKDSKNDNRRKNK